MRARFVVIAVSCLAASPLAGCGSSSSPTLDTAAVQHAIATTIDRQHHVKTHVRCPSGVPRKKGVSFTCTARLQVGSYPVRVSETNGSGHVRFANRAPLVLLDTPRVESSIAQAILTQRRLRARVSCPPEVLQRAGISFTCTARIGSRRYPFVVTQTNDSGHVRYVGVR